MIATYTLSIGCAVVFVWITSNSVGATTGTLTMKPVRLYEGGAVQMNSRSETVSSNQDGAVGKNRAAVKPGNRSAEEHSYRKASNRHGIPTDMHVQTVILLHI